MDKQETKDAGMNSTAESNRPGLSNAEREAFEAAHKEAIENQTADSYLLGYLPEAELDAFEEHYFDCRVCADTVRAGADMFAAGREVAKRKKTPAPVSRFRHRTQLALSWAAAATVAFVLIMRPPAPDVPPRIMEVATPGGAITGVMRGTERDIFVHFEDKRPVEIVMTTPPEPLFPQYRLELRDQAGKVLEALDMSPDQVRHVDGVPVLLRALPTGRYVLAILGVHKDGNRSEIVGQSLVVQ